MKSISTYQILTIVTGLATTIIAGNPLSAIALPTATSAHQQLISQADMPVLAKQLQGKPVIVDIYASWCPGCQNIAPTLTQLKQKYGNKANFIVFDVSDRKKSAASMQMAIKLGLGEFFNEHKSQTSTVAIIDPATGKITKQFQNNPDLDEYTSVIDLSIAQMSKKGDAMKKP